MRGDCVVCCEFWKPKGMSTLRPVEEIPAEFRNVFKFPYFNVIQSMVFDEVYYTDKSVVVSAPTGAGKTAIFEIAIVRLLTYPHLYGNGKIIYMAPIKALCTERYNDWKEKFEPYGVCCIELTGDTESDDFQKLEEANLILTTPEKWDSMSRKWKDNKSLFHTISLFLVDEVHILSDHNRGATVEAVLSRMKTLILADKNRDKIAMRFIAVSATIPNIQDLADWLGSFGTPALYFRLEDKFRPVKLQKIVLGYVHKEGESEFKFDINLTYKLKNIIDTYSNGKPTLVFCSSRKMAAQTVDVLMKQNHGRTFARQVDATFLKQESLKLRDAKVSNFISNGIGVHHAGMDTQDRHNVEELFRQGILPVLVATSTLAMGVNLPAHLVILKSTTFYNMGWPTEYSDIQVLQMIGRAGRPQFDTTATAVIMTKTASKAKYQALVTGTQIIESSLHKNLIEHLNAEIVLHTITDIALAVEWTRHTFLYVRIMKNPSYYGVPQGFDKKQVEKSLEDLCLKSINALAELNLVKMNEETLEIESTETGKLMARYCIAYDTMKRFHAIKGEEHIDQLLARITDCSEFQDVTLRQTEKSALNALNKDKNKENIRYPMTGKIKTKQMKVNCLIQASFGCLPIPDYVLTNDTTKIFKVGQRVVRCLLEFLWQRKYYRTLLSAIQLLKCFKQRLWEDSKYVTKQINKIGTALSLALANAGLISFHKVGETNPREIELIANRHPPFGNQIKEAVANIPKYELAIEQVKKYKASTAELIITIHIINKDILQAKDQHHHQGYLLIGDADNNIVFKWRIIDCVLLKYDGWRRKIDVQRCNGGPELFVHLLSQEWVGVDIHTIYVPMYTHNNIQQLSTNHPEQVMVQNRNQVQSQPLQQASINVDHRISACAHRCMNKLLCAHKCCKDGVTVKRSSKTLKRYAPVNELSLNVKIKNLKNRAQGFPQAFSDIKRPRFGIFVQQTSLNTTDVRNLMSEITTDKSNIRVKDGWEKLHQHEEKQALQDQGNFDLELSPVIENYKSPTDIRISHTSICTMDEFEDLFISSDNSKQASNIFNVSKDYSNIGNRKNGNEMSLDMMWNDSYISSIEPICGKNLTNYSPMMSRPRMSGASNSIDKNKKTVSMKILSVPGTNNTNNDDDVKHWSPGYFSDLESIKHSYEKQKKSFVISSFFNAYDSPNVKENFNSLFDGIF